MNPWKTVLIGLMLSFLLLSACGSAENNGGTIVKSTTADKKKLLTAAILFKTAAGIQDKCFRYLLPDWEKSEDAIKFFKILNDYVLGKRKTAGPGAGITFRDNKYLECLREISSNDHSFWRAKQVLTRYRLPDTYKFGKVVVFNPFIFFPSERGVPLGVTDVYLLWDWFYAAIFLKDLPFLEETAPAFWKLLENSPMDLAVFKKLYRLSRHPDSISETSAPAAANYYLLAGNEIPWLKLSQQDRQKISEIKNRYDTNYLKKHHITVNAFTLNNREYMWLAAREAEINNDIDRAYIYLKTTFDNSVLSDVKNFHPPHQVYLYTTIRIALEIHSPRMYRYVLGALAPLSKFYAVGNKELLVRQLYQLID